VRAGGGQASARVLVIATNAFAPGLCPALAPLIQPRRGQMLSTAPLGAMLYPRPTSAHWGYRYWRQTPDLRLVIGGWRDTDLDGETGYDDRATEPIQRAIEQGLAEIVAGDVTIERRWAGTMGFARDGRPLVGWLDATHHLAICAGYTGHGMGMAAGCTLELADLLDWQDAGGIATFAPSRFPELRAPREGIATLGAGAKR
jgi:gamma-glutamylputrescine oxidase